MNFEWMGADLALVRAAIEQWDATPVAHPRRRFREPPFSDDPTAPTVFLTWEIVYQKVENLTFGSDNPYREGFIRCAFWCQPGEGLGPYLVGKLEDLAELLYPIGDDGFQVFAPRPAMAGRATTTGGAAVGDKVNVWWVEGLDFPFKAT